MSRMLVEVEESYVPADGTHFDAVCSALDHFEIDAVVIQSDDEKAQNMSGNEPALLSARMRRKLRDCLMTWITESDAFEGLWHDAVQFGRVGLDQMNDRQLCETAHLWCLEAADYGLKDWPVLAACRASLPPLDSDHRDQLVQRLIDAIIAAEPDPRAAMRKMMEQGQHAFSTMSDRALLQAAAVWGVGVERPSMALVHTVDVGSLGEP